MEKKKFFVVNIVSSAKWQKVAISEKLEDAQILAKQAFEDIKKELQKRRKEETIHIVINTISLNEMVNIEALPHGRNVQEHYVINTKFSLEEQHYKH